MAPAWQWQQADLIPWEEATLFSPVRSARCWRQRSWQISYKPASGSPVTPSSRWKEKHQQERLSPEFWHGIELTPFEGGVRTTVRADLMKF